MTVQIPVCDMHELHRALYQHSRHEAVDSARLVAERLDVFRLEQVIRRMPQELQAFIQLRYGERLSVTHVAKQLGQSVDLTYHDERRTLDYLRHDATKRRYEHAHQEVFEEIDTRLSEAERVARDTERLYAVLGHLINGRLRPEHIALRHVDAVRPDVTEETPVAFLPLKRKEYNIFRRLGLETAEDVLRYGAANLREQHRVGTTTITHIKQTFRANGFDLQDEPQDLPPRREYVPARHVPEMQTVADIDAQVAAMQAGEQTHLTLDVYPAFGDMWAGVLTLTGRK